jgi:hypothetical protein
MTRRLQRRRLSRPRDRGPHVEQLEDRRLLSGVAPYAPAAPQALVGPSWAADSRPDPGAGVGDRGPAAGFGALFTLARLSTQDDQSVWARGEGLNGGDDGHGSLGSLWVLEGVRGAGLADDGFEFLVIAEGFRGEAADLGQVPPVPSVVPTGAGTAAPHSGSPVSPEFVPASDSPALARKTSTITIVLTSPRSTTGGESAAPSSDVTLAPAGEALTPARTTAAPSGTGETAVAPVAAEPATPPEQTAAARPAHSLPLPATANDVVAVVAAGLVSYGPQTGRGRDGVTSLAEHVSRLLASNGTGREVRGAGDSLTGGSAQAEVVLAVPPRPAAGGPREIMIPAPTPGAGAHEATPAADRGPDGPVKARQAEPGGTAERPQDGAAPQEAGLHTDVAGSSLAGLGRLRDQVQTLLGDLADSAVVWRVAPVLAAALLGGTAFGIARRRRKKRQRPGLPPAAPAKDTDTWLPPPTEPPGVDVS